MRGGIAALAAAVRLLHAVGEGAFDAFHDIEIEVAATCDGEGRTGIRLGGDRPVEPSGQAVVQILAARAEADLKRRAGGNNREHCARKIAAAGQRAGVICVVVPGAGVHGAAVLRVGAIFQIFLRASGGCDAGAAGELHVHREALARVRGANDRAGDETGAVGVFNELAGGNKIEICGDAREPERVVRHAVAARPAADRPLHAIGQRRIAVGGDGQDLGADVRAMAGIGNGPGSGDDIGDDGINIVGGVGVAVRLRRVGREAQAQVHVGVGRFVAIKRAVRGADRRRIDHQFRVQTGRAARRVGNSQFKGN